MDKLAKVRAEVERLDNEWYLCNSSEAKYKRETYKEILDFINSLQQEPVNEDLEKAAEQDVCEVVNTCSATGIPNDHIPSWVQDAMINEFIHGAKWQKEQLRTVGDRTMSKAEKFIQDYTRNCSNELDSFQTKTGAWVDTYHEWLTPDQARRAVEIAREEMIDKAIGWIEEINNHHHIMRYSDSCEPPISELTEWFKNYIKEGGKDE